MKSDKELRSCLEAMAEKKRWEWSVETACLLNGAWNLYEALKSNPAAMEEGTGGRCREIVKKAMEQLAADVAEQNGEELKPGLIGSGRLLFPLYREEENESFKETAVVLQNWLMNHDWSEKNSENWAEEFYLTEPFYLEYENQFHAKEQYNRIQEQLKKAEALARRSVSQQDLNPVSWYLMAMIDSSGLVSEEVFDHYKNAEGYFKTVLKMVPDRTGLPVIYSVLKGCRLGALLTEKYKDQAVTLLTSAEPVSVCEKGILLMAYAEALKLCPEGAKL